MLKFPETSGTQESVAELVALLFLIEDSIAFRPLFGDREVVLTIPAGSSIGKRAQPGLAQGVLDGFEIG